MQEKNKSYEKNKFRIRRIRFYSAKVTSIQKSPQITRRTHGDSSQSHTHTIPIAYPWESPWESPYPRQPWYHPLISKPARARARVATAEERVRSAVSVAACLYGNVMWVAANMFKRSSHIPRVAFGLFTWCEPAIIGTRCCNSPKGCLHVKKNKTKAKL